MSRQRTLLFAIALLFAASPARAQTDDSGYVLRTYVIKDLIYTLTVADTAKASEWEQLQEAEREKYERIREQEAAEFVEMMQVFMEPKFEKGRPGQSVEIGGRWTILLLRATPEQHKWTAEFLVALKQGSIYFEIETHVLTVAESSLAELALGDTPSILGDAAATTAFLEKAKSLKQIDLLQAPKILALNGQRATMSTVSQTSYIKRYDEVDLIEPERKRLVDPVIDVAKEGLEWKLRAVALPGNSIVLESDLEISELVRPIPQRETPYGKISVPEVRTKRVQSTVRLRPGQCLVLSSNPTDGKRLVLLLKATPIEAGDLEQAGKEPAAEPSERKR